MNESELLSLAILGVFVVAGGILLASIIKWAISTAWMISVRIFDFALKLFSKEDRRYGHCAVTQNTEIKTFGTATMGKPDSK